MTALLKLGRPRRVTELNEQAPEGKDVKVLTRRKLLKGWNRRVRTPEETVVATVTVVQEDLKMRSQLPH